MTDTQVPGDVTFLRRTLDAHKRNFLRRRDQNRRLALGLKLLTVIIGAAVTVLIGAEHLYQPKVPKCIPLLALILSAAIPVVAAYDAFFDPRWLWIQNATLLTKVYAISDDLEYKMAGSNKPSQEELDRLYQGLKDALQEANTGWANKRMTDTAAQKKDGSPPGSPTAPS